MQTYDIGMSYDLNLAVDVDTLQTFHLRQKIPHIISGLGQKYDLVIKVSHPNKITKVKTPLVETDRKYGFVLKNIHSHN